MFPKRILIIIGDIIFIVFFFRYGLSDFHCLEKNYLHKYVIEYAPPRERLAWPVSCSHLPTALANSKHPLSGPAIAPPCSLHYSTPPGTPHSLHCHRPLLLTAARTPLAQTLPGHTAWLYCPLPPRAILPPPSLAILPPPSLAIMPPPSLAFLPLPPLLFCHLPPWLFHPVLPWLN